MKTPVNEAWQRMLFDKTPVYIHPEAPHWVVPSTSGDRLVAELKSAGPAYIFPDAGKKIQQNAFPDAFRTAQFFSLFPSPSAPPYAGREKRLTLLRLEECWLHITNQCNLSCTHCLFGKADLGCPGLSPDQISAVYDETYALGTRTYYLTGGEPMIHPGFEEICTTLLTKNDDTNLVILSNALLFSRHRRFFDTLPKDRLYLQVSIDGIGPTHERIRGKGTYPALIDSLESIVSSGIDVTLAMAVTAQNFHQMADVVDLARTLKIKDVHYLWLMITGNARPDDFVHCDNLFAGLCKAQQRADQCGVVIDNVRNMEFQVFAPAGTKHDLTNAGWSSLAVGPDGIIYPTAALVGHPGLGCGHIEDSIESAWKKSPVLDNLRGSTLTASEKYNKEPLKFIVGGGDIDHSMYAGGKFIGHDPYIDLYNQMALWIIHRYVSNISDPPYPAIRARMGDKILQCHGAESGVAMTHSNCVLPFARTRQVVGDFYSKAATTPNLTIANPVCYPEEEISHIPQHNRIRSYGCGSPVLDADIGPGDVVVDLGSGTGVECYIAGKRVGRNGMAIGIDMLDNMLEIADQSRQAASEALGFSNVFFIKGFLESLPLGANSVDRVISNCVINLSEDKQAVFSEIFRILKPGGALVISDVVTDTEPPLSVRNDPGLHGECIAGAMEQPRLLAMLEGIGFENIKILKRFFYRMESGHPFYSITYQAFCPDSRKPVSAIYPGPYAAIITDGGQLLIRGRKTDIRQPHSTTDGPCLFLLDTQGSAANVDAQNSCACYTPPETSAPPSLSAAPASPIARPGEKMEVRYRSDCMYCGAPLKYRSTDSSETCIYCGTTGNANAVCENNHYVCDTCHGRDVYELTRHICTNTSITDMITLLNRLRNHPAFPLHGPEHHFAVPGIIVATFRNLGGDVDDTDILSAIDRGRGVPGGTCGFWGVCGAAAGVGIGFATLLKSNPLKPNGRRRVAEVTAHVLEAINRVKAPRCCQRECWTALIEAAKLSGRYLPIPLEARDLPRCGQQTENRECIGRKCPYFDE